LSDEQNREARGNRGLVILGGQSTDQPSFGGLMRRHHLLRAAGRVASLDIFVMVELDHEEIEKMSSIYGARVGCVGSASPSPSRMLRFLQYVRHAGSPTRVAGKHWGDLRRQLRSWMSSYQFTLIEHVENYPVLAPILQAPIIIDLDDRDSDVLRQIRRVLRAEESHRRRGLVGWAYSEARKTGRDLYLMLDQYRWLRAERLIVKGTDSVLVASHEDLLTSPDPRKAVVVPNGFELRGSPVGSSEVHSPPTVAFWGLMSYRPNRDGARWLLSEVLPLLLRRIPDVRVLIIGHGSKLLTLPEYGQVVATGFVDDLSALLSETDVAIVPLRAGGGTRIKIIEAWANNIPVVSTPLGAYGLGAVHGENLLLAEAPEDFASAITSALEDSSLRRHLIAHGAARARAFRWSAIETGLSEHLAALMARTEVAR
jgi:glycosyltransferase involved in cell wall biosynthesis